MTKTVISEVAALMGVPKAEARKAVRHVLHAVVADLAVCRKAFVCATEGDGEEAGLVARTFFARMLYTVDRVLAVGKIKA